MELRSHLAPRAKAALLRSGFYGGFRRLFPSRHLAILRYHAICDPGAGYADAGICVSPGAFAEQVAYLAAHYDVMPLPDAVEALRRGAPLPRNAVAITFDDGYADNRAAAQTLSRHGLSATFYITAGCLAGGQPFWPAEIRALVNGLSVAALDLTVGSETVRIAVATPAQRKAAISQLTRLFKAHPIPVRERMRDQLRRAAGSPAMPSAMLTWSDLSAMCRMGMTIGSHTMTHPNLPNAGLADAAREITESKAALERELGVPVTMFSYPNGGAERYMTPEIARLVREAGFTAATTSRNAFATTSSDLFALERIQVSEQLEELVFALEIERYAFKPQPRPGELQ